MAVELRVRDFAPAFRAQAIGGKYGDGKAVSLADFRGSAVVLYFYPKDDTPGCTVQACGLRDAWGELSAHANIFGVSVDSAASHEKFIKKHQLPFPLLSDADKKIVGSYGVWVEKSMYGKKYMGAEEHVCYRSRWANFRNFPEGQAGGTRHHLAKGPARRSGLTKEVCCRRLHPMVALRSGKPASRSNLYGLPEETTKSEDLQTQAPQAHEGESPQEAFALQVVSTPLFSPSR